MELQRPPHRLGESGDVFARVQPHVADQIVAVRPRSFDTDGTHDRIRDVLDQNERQRIASRVPADAVLLVVEESETGMERDAALAYHQPGAQDAQFSPCIFSSIRSATALARA